MSVCLSVCVCVCVSEGGREGDAGPWVEPLLLLMSLLA